MLGVLLLSGLAIGALVTDQGGGRSPAVDPGAVPRSDVAVEVRTLAETADVDGTLGFADRTTLTAGAAGTVTGSAPEGDLVERGGTLYTLDE